MIKSFLSLPALCLSLAGIPTAGAQVTYIDANTSNVTRVDASPFAPVATASV